MQFLRDFDNVVTFLSDVGCEGRTRVAVVYPHDFHTVEAVENALRRLPVDFILVGRGDDEQLHKLSEEFAGRIELIVAEEPDEAARVAVSLVRDGKADVIMKGLINTDNLLRAILNKQEGILEKGAVLSHITGAQIAGMGRLLFFSDAAVIPAPNLEQHSAIVGYLADVCRAFGIKEPRIALIHCTEKTSEKFPVTLSYAEIKQRAARNEYGSVIVDGPMDVKTALDAHSGEVKGIKSPIDGHADALVFPDIQAGNVFYKSISFFAHSLNAGMLMGAKVPVVLPSRSDSSESKLCSIAMACLYSRSKKS